MSKTPPPKVSSWAADIPARNYFCSGCGCGEVSCWDKQGVDHWVRDASGREVVCGYWVLIGQHVTAVGDGLYGMTARR